MDALTGLIVHDMMQTQNNCINSSEEECDKTSTQEEVTTIYDIIPLVVLFIVALLIMLSYIL